MAIVKDNILMQLVRGTLGKHFIIYERNGQIIMAVKHGPSKKKPTQKQLEARHKMTIASAQAQELMADPEIKAYYQSLAGPGQNTSNMAVKGIFFNLPAQIILTCIAPTLKVGGRSCAPSFQPDPQKRIVKQYL